MNARFLGLLTVSLCGCGVILGIADVPTPNDSGSTDSASDQQADGTDANVADTVAPKNDVDPGPCVADAGACNALLTNLPPGWTPAIFAPTLIGCPNDFTGSIFYTDPQVQLGACSCAPINTTPPTCTTVKRRSGTQCGTVQNAPDIIVNGMCGTAAGTLGNSEELTPQPASGGACTSNPQPDQGKFTTGKGSVCETTACAQNICAGIAPPNYVACIETMSDTACPANTPFQTRHAAGSNMALDCNTACGACTPSGACGMASVRLYSDGSCANPITNIPADGVCRDFGLTGTSFASEGYAVTLSNVAYTPSAPQPGKVATSGARTLCCTK